MHDVWRDRRVVVTGGLGFIGSNLAIRLAQLGARVVVIDLPDDVTWGQASNIQAEAERLSVIRADLSVPGDWRQYIVQADCVFHLAGQVSHIASMSDPALDLRHNCGSLLNVLEAARTTNPGPRVVLTSTRQVYGRAMFLPVTEDHPRQPPDINGVHRVACEEYLRLYRDVHGVPTCVVRLANTYGPRMDLRNPGRGVLNVFLARALAGQPLTIFGDGTQRRDINYVDDVVDALLLAATCDEPGPLQLGTESPTSLQEFAAVLTDLLPTSVEYRPFPAQLEAIDVGDSHCDISRMEAATGWRPRTCLREGLLATIAYFRDTAAARPDAAPVLAAP